ncbi:aspartate aminotransferase family protein [Mesorhizobium shangrilense]|uniref:Aspartate aminotransferase family protein n=1 Tax=Mesorhizobium shangrilense TaxID=460060 RepID=A0ABV2DEL2_9HYPH
MSAPSSIPRQGDRPSPVAIGESSAFHRDLLAPTIREAVAGDGVYIIDRNGNRYLDGSSGSGPSCLGHSNAAVRAAMHAQIDAIAYAHTAFFTTAPMEELAENLCADAPDQLSHVWFTNSGAEAADAALKLTRQYFLDIGQPERHIVIGRRAGYVGSTLAGLAAGGSAMRRGPFSPVLPTNTAHIGPAYAYRGLLEGETLDDFALRTARELEAVIEEVGPSRVSAFICETVVGATLGAVEAPSGYFREIRRICDRYGILLILDEVMCGMGRVGTRYAFTQEGVAPDLVMIGKALAGGYAPLGGVLVSNAIHDAIRDKTGFFWHGHSFHGHTLACAAALAVQREIERRDLYSNIRKSGALLDQLLRERFAEHPHVGDIRGRGLIQGIELVADRATKRNFDPSHQIHTKLSEHALDLGLICYASSSSSESGVGEHVLLMPPYIVEPHHIEEMVDKLGRAVDRALRAESA